MVLPSAITEAGKAAARTKSDSIGARPTITTIATIIATIVEGTVRQRDFVEERSRKFMDKVRQNTSPSKIT